MTINDTPAPTAEEAKQSNEDRKKEALYRKAMKADAWRVQVWAQSERRIQGFNAELAVLGADPYQPMETDFEDQAQLEHYATMPLS